MNSNMPGKFFSSSPATRLQPHHRPEFSHAIRLGRFDHDGGLLRIARMAVRVNDPAGNIHLPRRHVAIIQPQSIVRRQRRGVGKKRVVVGSSVCSTLQSLAPGFQSLIVEAVLPQVMGALQYWS